MALSYDLISEFVKVTNDRPEKNTETTVYGTIKITDGKTYVQIDGSTVATPVSTTTDVKDGDRVTVLLKDHSAVVTGNLSAPSATKKNLDEVKDEANSRLDAFDIVVADKVSTEQLNAVKGDITDLTTKNLEVREQLTAHKAKIDPLAADNVTVQGQIEAHSGKFDDIQATFVKVTGQLTAHAGKFDTLEATDAEFRTLQSDYGTFKTLTTTNLEAANAEIGKLKTDKADISELTTIEADITALRAGKLDADSATIKDLQADVANIDTLIFGTASGDTIQASFANAVIAQLGNAQIKSAMIQDISASKITAGDVITNNVRVMSEDGKLLISDETIQISDATRVRVQIGKDASGDYSISIWDTDGKLMFSEGGITDNAIKNAIIRNDMVSDTANISAHKIDINSLFEEINGSTKTIKSSKIYLDDEKQTLDVAFTSMSSDLEDLSGEVTSQGTQITAIQGQIASKVWQQDIKTSVDGAKQELSTQYSTLEQRVDGISSTVSSHTSELSKSAEAVAEAQRTADAAAQAAATAQAAADGAAERVEQTEADLTTAQQNLANVVTRVGATEEEIAAAQNAVETAQAAADKAKQDAAAAQSTANTAKANAATAQTAANNAKAAADKAQADVNAVTTRVTTAETNIAQNTEQIALRATKTELGGYYTKSEADAAINVKADAITSSVSSTYATKQEVSDIKIGGRNLLPNTDFGGEPPRYERLESNGSEGGFRFYPTEQVESGVEYTVSLNLRGNANLIFYEINQGGNVSHLFADREDLDPEEYRPFSITFSVWDNRTLECIFIGTRYGDTNTLVGDWFEIEPSSLKLERGNKATDWTPAPEDTENKISSVAGDLTEAIDAKGSEVLDSANSNTAAALESYVPKSEYDTFTSETTSTIEQMSGQIDMRFETTETSVTNVEGKLQAEIAERSKHITFSGDNAISIGGTITGIVLTVDNDNGIIFSRIVSKDGGESQAEVISSNVLYQLGTDKTTVPTGEWSETIPSDMDVDQFLWIRKVITYSDGTQSTTDSVAFGSWDGDDFYTGNIVVRVDERAQFGKLAFIPNRDGSLSFRKVGG